MSVSLQKNDRLHSRRTFLKSGSAIAVLAGIPGLITGCTGHKQPNIVFILVDDLGWSDLGCYGSTFYESPEIDRLAQSAMRFTDAYAASPVCSPTRASIMTGHHPARLHITDWIPGQDPKDRSLLGPQDRNELPLEAYTIAEALAENNYQTGFFGKWHLGSEGFYPEDQGYSINKGGHHRGSPPGGYYSPYNNPRLDDGPEGEYLPDRLTDEAIRFVETQGDRPFFLNLSFYTVHTPIQASEKHLERFEQKAASQDVSPPEHVDERSGRTRRVQNNPAYASMVYAMDENVGRLLYALDGQGIADDTIVIFTSDNGGLSTLHPNRTAPTANGPLRAGKGWCYEGGIRVPLIISAPGITGPGSTCQVPVISTDLYPTMLDLAGRGGDVAGSLDGVSLKPVLKGGNSLDRDALYWHFPHYHGSMWTPGAAIRQGDWKLIEFYEEQKTELYHLAEDIEERNDVSDTYPDRTASMKAQLLRWQEEVDAQMPVPNR